MNNEKGTNTNLSPTDEQTNKTKTYLGKQGTVLQNIQNKKQEIDSKAAERDRIKVKISYLKNQLKNKGVESKYQETDYPKLSLTDKLAIRSEIFYLTNLEKTILGQLLDLNEKFKEMVEVNKLKSVEHKINLNTKNINWCIKNKWQIKNRVLILLEDLRLKQSDEITELKFNSRSVEEFNKLFREILNKHNHNLSMYCTNGLYKPIFNETRELFEKWDGTSPLKSENDNGKIEIDNESMLKMVEVSR